MIRTAIEELREAWLFDKRFCFMVAVSAVNAYVVGYVAGYVTGL